MPKFEDIQIGDSASLKKSIQEKDVETFARLTGDTNPLHMDESFAKKTKFGARVSHGMLTSSFISTLIGMDLPGKGSILTNISLDFKKPVFIGDTLIASIEVTKKVLLIKQVFLKINIGNQHSKIGASGTAKSICSG
jgi:3-hydroxybutyryl-CoA dehydratase